MKSSGKCCLWVSTQKLYHILSAEIDSIEISQLILVLKIKRTFAEKLQLCNMKNTQESLLWKYCPRTSEYPSIVTPEDKKWISDFWHWVIHTAGVWFFFCEGNVLFPSWRMCLIHFLNYRHPLLRDIIFQKTLDFKWEWIFWRNWNFKCLKFKSCGTF